jgi:MFS family permease
MKRAPRWYDYLTINIFWLGLTVLVQTNTGMIFPLLVEGFVGEARKGTYFGKLRLWSLMAALLVQALTGMLSDRNASRWGRRRPYILVGTLANLIFIVGLGYSAGLRDMSGYWVMFGMAVMVQIFTNAAQGAQLGLIPDLVPEDRRGRFSGVKAVLEFPLPLLLVAVAIAPQIEAGNLWGGLLIAMAVLGFTMLLTMLVREQPLRHKLERLNWIPFLRLMLMTGLFTAFILGMGAAIRALGSIAEGLQSTAALLALMGGAGLLAMVIVVGLGVWASVRINIGQAARSNRSYTWWVINRLAFLVGATNLSSFAVYFLQERLGLDSELAAGPGSRLILGIGLLTLITAIFGGWLVDRFGARRLVALSGVGAALGTLVAIADPSLVAIYIGGCIIGAAAGLFLTANWALGTKLVAEHEAGRYLGIANLAGAGAGAVGAYIGGPIADLMTSQVPEVPGLGYVLIFAVYGVMFLISTLALKQVRDPKRLTPET